MTLITNTIDSATDPPSELVTLLFTDIEGSTHLLEALGDQYAPLLMRCRLLLEQAVAQHRGEGTPSEGDAFFAVFKNAGDAVRAAVDIQRTFHSESWPANGGVRIRVGVHTGQPRLINGNY